MSVTCIHGHGKNSANCPLDVEWVKSVCCWHITNGHLVVVFLKDSFSQIKEVPIVLEDMTETHWLAGKPLK
jgi:hypothetical protein